MSIRYRDVSLEEMVALNHSIRVHRDALLSQAALLTETVRSKNHRARAQLGRIEAELIMLAAEVEGHACRVFGVEAWDLSRRKHWEECSLKATTASGVQACALGGSE